MKLRPIHVFPQASMHLMYLLTLFRATSMFSGLNRSMFCIYFVDCFHLWAHPCVATLANTSIYTLEWAMASCLVLAMKFSCTRELTQLKCTLKMPLGLWSSPLTHKLQRRLHLWMIKDFFPSSSHEVSMYKGANPIKVYIQNAFKATIFSLDP